MLISQSVPNPRLHDGNENIKLNYIILFSNTRFIVMFITTVCVLFLIKLRWPKKKNCSLPFDNASVDKLLDDVKSAAEVTAKDWFEVVFVPASPSVWADVFPTVGTKWKSYV